MKKYDIFWVNSNPTKGSEQSGLRPGCILQNNIANQSQLQTVCIAPFTSNYKPTPSGILIPKSPQNQLPQDSRLELSQLRVIDKQRLEKQLGTIDFEHRAAVNQKLSEFFDLSDRF